MKFAFVLFLWILMALTLVAGLVLAVDGRPCLLCVGVVAFILAVAKVGCLTH
jgi:hypothetical protein